jgi:predicted SnoaL-like aldol condensation-catalyzing enzyme
MKTFQRFSAALVLMTVFAACGNDASKESAGNTETTAANAIAVDAGDANQLSSNKKIVTDFIQVFYGGKDSTAIDKYIADDIKQHNYVLQDGKEWLKNRLRPFLQDPEIQKTTIDIRQIAAEGDKVWTLIREVAPNGREFARAEIWRIENGKIAEQWLVYEAVPKTSENKNGMF